MSNKLPPRLTEKEMTELAVETVQDFVNACNCKTRDDILLALSFWLNVGISAGEAVKHGKAATIQ